MITPFKILSIFILSCQIYSIHASNEENRFKKASKIVWHETQAYIDTGSILFDVEVKLLNPCTVSMNQIGPQLTPALYKMKSQLAEGINRRCQDEYEKQFLQKLDELAKCQQTADELPTKIKRIVRRQLGAITLGVIFFITMVSSIMNIKVIDERTMQLNGTLHNMRDQIEDIRGKLRQQAEINLNSVDFLKGFSDRMQDMEMILEDVPQTAWESSIINRYIDNGSRGLEVLNRKCLKGKVSIPYLNEFIPSKYFTHLSTDKTILQNLTVTNRTHLRIQFFHPKLHFDTKIYKIEAIEEYANYTGERYGLKYASPSYVIHNVTANCTKGTDVGKGPIFSVCSEQNYLDPDLQKWIRVERKEGEIPIGCSMKQVRLQI